MLDNNVIQHIGTDPAGQLAQLKTWHRWNSRGSPDNSSQGHNTARTKKGTETGKGKKKRKNEKLYKKDKKKMKQNAPKMKA